MIADKPKALVMGLGKSGLSCVHHLLSRGYDVEVVDTRSRPPMLQQMQTEFPGARFAGQQFDPEYMQTFDLVVSSPGLSIREGAIAAFIELGGRVIGDVEIFAAAAKAPVIAITGANGKSTVTDLVGQILATAMRVEVGGNIGTPVLDLLEKPVPDVYVLELSSFQLETTYSLDAEAAVVLNISEDHMDRYTDITDYAGSKQRIFQGEGIMVLNRDDPLVMAMAQPGRQSLTFTIGEPTSENEFGIAEHDRETWLMKGRQPLVPTREIRIAGRHNHSNVLAALALIDHYHLPLPAVREAISSYQGLPHRCQVVTEFNGVQWINDSKATNIGATAAALAGMDRPVVLIAGGEGKGADFSSLAEVVSKSARSVILIGRDAGIIEAALTDTTPVLHAQSMEQAVRLAADAATPGDAVLLSPACASFDMFENFEHRGQVFTDLVQAMTQESRGSLS